MSLSREEIEKIAEATGKRVMQLVASTQKRCGLTSKELVELGEALESIYHAVEEEDWDRMEPDFNGIIAESAEKMEKSGCSCLPHGMIDPTEEAEFIRVGIESHKVNMVKDGIAGLAISILEG